MTREEKTQALQSAQSAYMEAESKFEQSVTDMQAIVVKFTAEMRSSLDSAKERIDLLASQIEPQEKA